MRWGIAPKIAIIFSSLALIGTLIVGIVITESSSMLLIDASAKRLTYMVDSVGVRLSGIFDALRSDAAFLARTPAVRDLAHLAKNETIASASDRNETNEYAQITTSFKALLESRPWYLDIYLIARAEAGEELVRVERKVDQIVEMPPAQLRQRRQQADFQKTVRLAPGELYLSRITLDRERGAVVQPQVPTIRAAMPVYAAGSEVFGIVGITVNMRPIFDTLKALVDPDANLYITNNRGDYLLHPDADKTFGFEGTQRYTLQRALPQTEPLFDKGRNALLLENVNWNTQNPVVAYFERLPFLREGDDQSLIIGVSLPRSLILEDVNTVRKRSAAYTLLFALGGIVLVLFISHRLTSPLRQITRAVARFSRGEQQISLPVGGNDEIGALADYFRLLVDRINRQRQDLADKEAHLRSLVETAVDGIIVIDEHGIVELFNPAAERIFGYRVDEVVGRNVNILMPSPDHEQHDEYLRHYLETGERHIIGIGRQVTGRHKQGHTIPLYLSIGEFTFAGKRRFTGILHDISEFKRLEEALAAARQT